MKITVNGEPRELPSDATVRDLILHLSLAKAACAVEVNRQLVPRKAHETVVLREGDQVEVVTLVGGG